MTSWVVLRHLCTDALGGSLGGGFFVVKVDIDRNRISWREYSAVQIALGKTVFATAIISIVWVCCYKLINSSNMGSTHATLRLLTPSVPPTTVVDVHSTDLWMRRCSKIGATSLWWSIVCSCTCSWRWRWSARRPYWSALRTSLSRWIKTSSRNAFSTAWTASDMAPLSRYQRPIRPEKSQCSHLPSVPKNPSLKFLLYP